MEVGVGVWVKDKSDWVAGTVAGRGESQVTVRLDDSGREVNFIFNDDNEELADVKLMNDPAESEVEDLINLPYLHEPAILHCLQKRYDGNEIYTYTGPILIAVNPFKKVPLYTTQILEMYYNLGLLKSQGIESSGLPPHVYAISDAAYRAMMGVILNSSAHATADVKSDQVILISGESGAGKTESTKIVLKYLTTLGSASGSMETEMGSIMDKILQSNPILEAFGNAKTIRNDNSSRFGKYIELNFNKRGHLIGGSIRTYLLEKVRLPTQQPGERNFHIFYQMAAGGSLEERRKWNVDNIRDFNYTNRGKIFELRWVNDAEEFESTRRALTTLGFPLEFQDSLLDVMAGLLHLGQLQFAADASGEGSILATTTVVTKSFESCATLFGVEVEPLLFALTTRIIVARNETYEKKLKPQECLAARDALAKALYGKIFDWIVVTINQNIQVEESKIRANIGVLDIFGFECFKENSFEQLCINYTNETLQQQFNQFVFKMEQAEYSKEKIEWSFIEFPDNQECLDLIEHRTTGILAMLDDVCKLPEATDEKFANRLYKDLKSHPRFGFTASQKSNLQFSVNHYAGIVVYTSTHFVDKNRDEFPREANGLFKASKNSLIFDLFQQVDVIVAAPTSLSRRATTIKESVGTQFKDQLDRLMKKIYETAPHYIRCLKPNDENVADSFNRVRTTEQLRYGGVLEAVRVARSGFPVRLNHSEFYTRYRIIANPFNPQTSKLPRVLHSTKHGHAADPRALCQSLIALLWDETVPEESDGKSGAPRRRRSVVEDLKAWKGKAKIATESVQIGQTKVFMRKQAHDILESRRSRRLLAAVKRIQCSYRGYLLRIWFITLIKAVRVLQRSFRGYKGRCQAQEIRRTSAATKIQTAFRSHMWYWKYNKFIYATVHYQSIWRGIVARREFSRLWFQVMGNRLKYTVIMLYHRRRYRSFRRAVIALQCFQRRYVAKKELRALRIAAKDVGRLKQSNEALKAEIEMLKAKAAEDSRKAAEKLATEIAAQKDNELLRLTQELEKTKKQLQEEIHQREQLEKELQEANAKINVRPTSVKVTTYQQGHSVAANNEEVESLKLELAKEKKERADLENEVERLRKLSERLSADGARLSPQPAHGQETALDKLDRLAANSDHTHKRRGSGNSLPATRSGRADSVPPRRGSQRRASIDEVKEARENWDETWDEESDEASESGSTVLSSDERPSSRASRGKWKKSFSERPMPEYHRKVNPVDISSTPAQKAIQAKALVGKFERNLEALKTRMRQGIRVFLWEGQRVVNAELIMKLTEDGQLSFSTPNRRFSLFASKIDVKSVKIQEILECIPGAHNDSIKTSGDDSCYLTMVIHSASHAPRTMTLMLDSREDRNSLLTGLRTLMSDVHINATDGQIVDSDLQGKTVVSRRSSFKDTLMQDGTENTAAVHASNAMDPKATPAGHPGQPQRRPSRRASATMSSAGNLTPAKDPVEHGVAEDVSVVEMKRQLLVERSNYERLMVQMLVLTNDLNEREDQIIALKKREAVYTETIANKERMYEQDAMVRMQLGKRLEQVLMDKEEIKDELDNLKAQLASIQNTFQQMPK